MKNMGSTGGINSKGMNDRVERMYKRERRPGGVSADWEPKPMHYEPNFLLAAWRKILLSLGTTVTFLAFASMTPLALILVVLSCAAPFYWWRQHRRFAAIYEGAAQDEAQVKRLEEVFE